MNTQVWLVVASTLLAGCAGFPRASQDSTPSFANQAPSATEPVLYGRDGKPVGEGAPTRGTASGRDAQNDGGRYTLLELYQRALDQRDAFEREVEALRAELAKTQGDLESIRQSLARQTDAATSGDGEKQRLAAENLDLAARLATAHIRRLQAEKTLLELQLVAQQAAPAPAEARAKSEPANQEHP